MTLNDFLTRWQHAYTQIGVRYLIMATVAFLMFYFVFKKAMLKRKIQSKFPKWTDYSRDFLYSVVSVAIFAGIATFTFFVIKPYTNMYSNVSDYPLWYFGLSMVWMFFLHDAYFYWSHRFMHHPKVFKYVHLIHHKSTNPSPWTAYAFHPLEAIIEALIVPIIAFTIPTHYLAITLYMLFQIVYNVYGHLGFEIMPKKFNNHFIGKWMNTSVAHNMHHKYFNDNYGLWTTIWDRMIGTMNKKYDEAYVMATEKKGAAETTSLETKGA
jgi:lathosterol oxidase